MTTQPTPFQPCDECRWFIVGDVPNNCARGHKMKFRMPEDGRDEAWGFYRDGCDDREVLAKGEST